MTFWTLKNNICYHLALKCVTFDLDVWDHFNELSEPNINKQDKCCRSGSWIKFVSGTIAVVTHLRRCRGIQTMTWTRRKSWIHLPPIISSHFFAKIDYLCQNELIKMFVAMELSFWIVDLEPFEESLSIVSTLSYCHLTYYLGTSFF